MTIVRTYATRYLTIINRNNYYSQSGLCEVAHTATIQKPVKMHLLGIIKKKKKSVYCQQANLVY